MVHLECSLNSGGVLLQVNYATSIGNTEKLFLVGDGYEHFPK